MGRHYTLHEDDAEMFLRTFRARYTLKEGWQLATNIRGELEWNAVDDTDAATLRRVNARLANG